MQPSRACDAVAETLEILSETISTPHLKVPATAFAGPLAGSELAGRIGAIHVGSCRSSGRIIPGAEAHAHIDGSAEICIFQMPESRVHMEWLIAHESAHITVARSETEHHGRAWQTEVARLGYPEDIAPHIDARIAPVVPAPTDTRSALFASVADIVMTESERNSPTLWRTIIRETRMTARRYGLLPQQT